MSWFSDGVSWLGRSLLGAAIGAIFGIINFLPDFSLGGLLAPSVAGAIAFLIIGALVAVWPNNSAVFLLICSFAGGIAGYAWSVIRSTDWQAGVVLGVMFGFLFPGIEMLMKLMSEGDSRN